MSVAITVQSTPITITVQDQAPITLSISAVGIPGYSIPAGGTAGQFLVKKSNTDYDYEWITYP
jgi:hypothetical protein